MAKRRANGEGSIRTRKDGRWEGRYTAGRDPVTGKAIYKNVLGKTQAEVEEKLKAAIEKSAVQPVRMEHDTVGQWLDTWLENYAKFQVRASSYKNDQGFISTHIKPALGDMPLEKLTSMDLQRLYKHLLDSGRVECMESRNKPEGLSVKTVRNINQMISSALNCAVEQRMIAGSPEKGCVLPKLERKEMKILPQKTKNSYRDIAIGTDTIEILKGMEQKDEYVFPAPYGGPMPPDSVLHMLQRVLKRAGLERIRFRRTFSVLALQNGVDVKTLSSMLGHYSAGFTLDTYAHVTTSMQKKAANAVGNFLSGPNRSALWHPKGTN